MTGISGANVSLHYGWERYWDAETAAFIGIYNTAAALVDIDKVFGHGAKISNLERNNNLESIYGLGTRTAQIQLEKQFIGSLSVEYILSNPWIFRYILGNAYQIGASATPTDVITGLEAGSLKLGLTSAADMVAGELIQLGSARQEYAQIRAIETNDVYLYSPTVFDHTSDATATPYDFTGPSPTTFTYGFNPFNTAPSITILNSLDLDTEKNVTFSGAVNTGNTMSFNAGDPVTFTSDFAYAKEVLSEDVFVSQTIDPFDVYSFAHGSLHNTTSVGNIGTAPPMAAVQSAEVTFATNADIIFGLGTRTGQTAVGKSFEFNIKASMFFQTTADLLELLYTGASGSTAPGKVAYRIFRLNAINGANIIQFDFGGVKIDTESLPQAVDAPIMEEVSMKANSLFIKVTNATAAIP